MPPVQPVRYRSLAGAFFAENRGQHRISLPASSVSALDARISPLAVPTGATLHTHLQAGTSAFTYERSLDCTDTLEAHTTLIPTFFPRWTFRTPTNENKMWNPNCGPLGV